MTKWFITRFGGARTRWQLVSFNGRAGGESRGIVDILAIRKDHRGARGLCRGDLFEIVLIQCKGGQARRPTVDECSRLQTVASVYNAPAVVLAEWKRQEHLRLYELRHSEWIPVDGAEVFA